MGADIYCAGGWSIYISTCRLQPSTLSIYCVCGRRRHPPLSNHIAAKAGTREIAPTPTTVARGGLLTQTCSATEFLVAAVLTLFFFLRTIHDAGWVSTGSFNCFTCRRAQTRWRQSICSWTLAPISMHGVLRAVRLPPH